MNRDYIIGIFQQLKTEVNGGVRYISYPEDDFVIFRISFKGFSYEYAMSHVSERMAAGTTIDDTVKDIKENYKKTLLAAFFKNDYRRTNDMKK
jgi:hypothetical protein